VADTSVAITPGSGASVDARSQPGGDLRQVVTIGDGDATPIAPVDAAGLHIHAGRTDIGPTPFRIAAATSATSLLNSNAARFGVVIHNDSTADLYVKYGGGAATTSYVYKVPAQGHLVLPEPGQPLFTGQITGIWTAAAGAANITELT
jgi:hypothetical protein